MTVLLTACAPRVRDADDRAQRIPVVKPFALERAGTRMAFEFEIPGERHQGRWRSVSIGFRVQYLPSKDNDAQDRRVQAYLQEAEMPMRMTVQHWRDGRWAPVTLVTLITLREGHGPGEYEYRPHPDPVFKNHETAHWDAMELTRSGYWGDATFYGNYKIGGFPDPRPGRYRLEFETLQEHPALSGSTYELVVAHGRIF